MKTQHTQGKLRKLTVSGNARLFNDKNQFIAKMVGTPEIQEANAERLALCWNMHDELVATLEYVEKYLKKDNGGGDESVWVYVQQALKRAKGGV